MSKADQAESLFIEGHNCAQAVLGAFAPDWGMSREEALIVSSGFGGGMARMGEVCGAITGAFMALGVWVGQKEKDGKKMKEPVYELMRKFDRLFREKRDSILCRDLLGQDISTPESYQSAAEKRLFRTICPGIVRDAVLVVEEIIKQETGQ